MQCSFIPSMELRLTPD